jgi:pyruvate formate lyase activating enzyme
MIHSADFFDDQPDVSICRLCPNQCRVAENHRGICLARGRENGHGVAYSFGQIVAAHLDPIEKKPLYHFFPGRPVFSVGSFGCNLKCRFCQNSDISQQIIPGEFIAPDHLVKLALEAPNNLGVAFTYNEPGIWYEYIMETAPLLKAEQLKTVLVTNGYLSAEPWRNLCGVTDAMNIDLKGFSGDFYTENCRGKLEPVLDNITSAVRHGVHVELTHLVIPGRNDNPADFERMIAWIAGVSPALPLHLSRFFPRYQETAPETPIATLQTFVSVAQKKLQHVFLGNVASDGNTSSSCPQCHAVWVDRQGYRTTCRQHGRVCSCGAPIPIQGLPE